MNEKLLAAVEHQLIEYKTLRRISIKQLNELGYEKSNMSLHIDAYPKGKDDTKVKFGLYSMVREGTKKAAIFSFLAPITADIEDQEGAVIDKPFSYFERMA